MAIDFLFDNKEDSIKNFDARCLAVIKSLQSKTKDNNHLLFYLLPKEETIFKSAETAKELSSISETLIVAGIGGSSLAGKIFSSLKKEKQVIFWEGVEPRRIEKAEENIDFAKCSLNIISKSGNTIETIVNSAFLLRKIKDACGSKWKERIVLTASEGNGVLLKWAKDKGIKIVEIPSSVGGRFSAFTPVGLIPALYCGLDGDRIAEGVEEGLKVGLSCDLKSNFSAEISKFYLSSLMKKNATIVIWGYGEICHLISLWVQQLWAESLGKKKISSKGEIRTGLFPVVLKGSEDQHSILQFLREGKTSSSVMFLSENYKGQKIGDFERNFSGLKKENLFYGD
ncbi:MAG: hypothetical protein N2445_05420, partial [Acidobacteria bacterium]|nr:hypothetical protein [Acidobacteriota bacterium]